jgi:hypothetical protein
MKNWISPSERSPEDLRTCATAYRRMADTAHTMDVVAALSRIADRFDAAANRRERETHNRTQGHDKRL